MMPLQYGRLLIDGPRQTEPIPGAYVRHGPVEPVWLVSPSGRSRKPFLDTVTAIRWARRRGCVGCRVVGRSSGTLFATIEMWGWDQLVEVARRCEGQPWVADVAVTVQTRIN